MNNRQPPHADRRLERFERELLGIALPDEAPGSELSPKPSSFNEEALRAYFRPVKRSLDRSAGSAGRANPTGPGDRIEQARAAFDEDELRACFR